MVPSDNPVKSWPIELDQLRLLMDILDEDVEKELANYVQGIGEPEPGESLIWTSVGLFSWLRSGHSSDFALDCHVVDRS